MLVLALDTSSAQVAVAVHDGGAVLARRREGDGRHHTERLAPAIAATLDDAGVRRQDLTDLAVGVGPGPYTSLRIGLVTARVVARALDVPVWGVCSLDVVARQAVADPAVLRACRERGARELVVATDARRREVYWARYRLDDGPVTLPVRVSGPEVGPAAGVPLAGAVVTGTGAALYPDAFGDAAVPGPDGVDAGTLAAVVAQEVGHPVGAGAESALLGAGASLLLPVEPMYLRPPDAVEPSGRKRVLGPV